MKKQSTIPTIIGVLVLLLGSLAGVYLSNNSQIFRIGADVQSAAKNIRVANISDTSVSITWTTDKPTVGYVVWGKSQNIVDKTANETDSNQSFYNHIVTLTGLTPSTKYYYKINSDGVMYENSGIPWEFTTGPTLPINKNSYLVSGSLIDSNGKTIQKALVYLEIGGYLFATETSNTGNFVFQIGQARTSDLQNYADINISQTLLQLSVQANPAGVATAQVFPQSANPMPAITIGQSHDFRSLPANVGENGGNPNVNLNLPQNSQVLSKFNVEIPSETPKPNSVILESLMEGEIITTQKPQFFGKGPQGATLSITVNSEETISDTLNIPKSGSWSYSVPTNLSPGNHSITISWVDVSGITRFITRNFVVQAGEVPAFTASGSGATASPSLTPTVKPTSIATATATPKSESSPTAMPVPVSGDTTPTLFLFAMAFVVLMFSLVIWKISET